MTYMASEPMRLCLFGFKKRDKEEKGTPGRGVGRDDEEGREEEIGV